jgi:hypothetical protein
MTLAAFVVGGLKAVFPDFPDQALWTLVGVAMAYVAVEGAIDLASVNQCIDATTELAKWTAEQRYKDE